jgi:hypothetical protein
VIISAQRFMFLQHLMLNSLMKSTAVPAQAWPHLALVAGCCCALPCVT